MLNNGRTLLTQHLQAALTSFNSLWHQPLATLMTVLVIAITLTLPALFLVMTDNMKQLTKSWPQGSHLSLYLKPGLTSTEEAAVLAHVRSEADVAGATLKTADEGLAEVQQQEGMQDIMHYLSENPLPAVIDVIPATGLDSSPTFERVFKKFKAYPEVDEAKIDMQWVSRLQAILSFTSALAYGLIILLAMAVVLIIGNTLRLAIHSRHEEIQVLKLIGAKNSFIIRPFLYSGIWYGLAGAIFAIVVVNIFLLSLTLAANQLATVYQVHNFLTGLSIPQMFLLLCSTVTLGWLAAWLSVRRQLFVIEP